MIYLGNKSSGAVAEAMASGDLGMMCTPGEGKPPNDAQVWAADNGCFGKGYPGDVEYLGWLAKHQGHADRCLFATAPDVVGNAKATLARSKPFFPVIRALGYRVALVAQDGLQHLMIPWDAFDVLFIGGSTEFKLSEDAARLVGEAKQRGKFVHMGRVNSLKRLKYAQAIGCDSTDGTFITFGPDINLPKVLGWLEDVHQNVSMFETQSLVDTTILNTATNT